MKPTSLRPWPFKVRRASVFCLRWASRGSANSIRFGLKFFNFEGAELMVSRTGYTGDLGYELWIAPAKAEALWDALFGAGELYGIRAIGTKALETARIEAGFIAARSEFLPANETVRSGRTRSPLELGLDWLVDFKKPNFNGRRALAEEQRNGSSWCLVNLDIEGNKPAHNAYIYSQAKARRKNIGFTTSAALVAGLQTEHRARHRACTARRARQYGLGRDRLPV